MKIHDFGNIYGSKDALSSHMLGGHKVLFQFQL